MRKYPRPPQSAVFTYPSPSPVLSKPQPTPAAGAAQSARAAPLHLSPPRSCTPALSWRAQAPRKLTHARPADFARSCRGGCGRRGEEGLGDEDLRAVSVWKVDEGRGRRTAEGRQRRTWPRSPRTESGSSGGGRCTWAGMRGTVRRMQGPLPGLPADECMYMTRLRLCSYRPRP